MLPNSLNRYQQVGTPAAFMNVCLYKAEHNVVYVDYLESGTGGNGAGIFGFFFN